MVSQTGRIGEMEKLENQIAFELRKAAFDIVIPGDYEKAALVLKGTKSMLKLVDEKEKEVTRPLNEGLKRARALFKPMKDKLNGVIGELGRNMFIFRRKQDEIARKKQVEIDKQASPEDIFVPQVETEVPKADVKIRKNYRFEIIDISKINSSFMVPDLKAIGEIVRGMKEKAVKHVGEGSIKIIVDETTY